MRRIVMEQRVTGDPDKFSVTGDRHLFVNYGARIENAVELGRYDEVDEDITAENFRTRRTWKTNVLVELARFNRFISTEDVLKWLDKMCFRPAELHELLALCQTLPGAGDELLIVALGSIWQARVGCVCFQRHASWRALGISNWIMSYKWSKSCSFAFVRSKF